MSCLIELFLLPFRIILLPFTLLGGNNSRRDRRADDPFDDPVMEDLILFDDDE